MFADNSFVINGPVVTRESAILRKVVGHKVCPIVPGTISDLNVHVMDVNVTLKYKQTVSKNVLVYPKVLLWRSVTRASSVSLLRNLKVGIHLLTKHIMIMTTLCSTSQHSQQSSISQHRL